MTHAGSFPFGPGSSEAEGYYSVRFPGGPHWYNVSSSRSMTSSNMILRLRYAARARLLECGRLLCWWLCVFSLLQWIFVLVCPTCVVLQVQFRLSYFILRYATMQTNKMFFPKDRHVKNKYTKPALLPNFLSPKHLCGWKLVWGHFVGNLFCSVKGTMKSFGRVIVT